MDFVRNVGNSTMRMMDDEAGAQVLFVITYYQHIGLSRKIFPRDIKWQRENQIVDFPRQPTATRTTGEPACDEEEEGWCANKVLS